MSINLQQINEESEKKKDESFDRLLKFVSQTIYSDNTHFIFELLQNAEDSIRRRGRQWNRRTIKFYLSKNQLRISHFGVPFNERDVRAICSIGVSTKDELTNIGRFGMGFKSVYRYTEHPAIHSGSGDYAVDFIINKAIYPKEVSPINRNLDETVFLLPFISGKERKSYEKIADGLENLEARKLLFLREIDEIQYIIEDYMSGEDYISGFYRRKSESINDTTRHITLIEQINEEIQQNEDWLIFSHPVSNSNEGAGYVEIAFLLNSNTGMVPLNRSNLVAYFPTVEDTGLKFTVQGPYQTTLSRESIPDNPWNKHLVRETALLLRDALCWMRDVGKLGTDVLNCLPFQQIGGRFDFLFNFVKELLKSEPLLPTQEGQYVSANEALLGRSKEIHELLSIEQLSVIYNTDKRLAWLDSNITRNRTRDLYDYLLRELKVRQITPEVLLRQLNQKFLEDQPEEWIVNFYKFINDRKGLSYLFKSLPIIRLKNGNHVTPHEEVYLPSKTKTGFPTVHPNICNSNTIGFLKYLGLREPDLVDDVIRYVLPKYRNKYFEDIDITEYERDLTRITRAYETDSQAQKNRLLYELKQTEFVLSLDNNNRVFLSKPCELYFRTKRLNELLAGRNNVRFIDENYTKLLEMRILLKKCGAMKHLNPIKVIMSKEKKQRLKNKRQTPGTNERFTDWDLRELQYVLERISSLDIEQRKRVSKLLWEELISIKEEYPSIFIATYTWTRHKDHYRETDEAAFIEQLRTYAWIPDIYDDLNLKPPSDIFFDDLGWEKDPVLLSIIKFKLPQLDQALQEADIDPKWLSVIAELEKQGKTPGDFLPTKQERDDTELAHKVPSDDSRFVEQLAEAMTIDPVPGPDEPVAISSGGPKTVESAVQDTISSASSGKVGSPKIQNVVSSTPGPEAEERAEKFETMLKEDYGKRCQICGSSFLTRKGNLHIFASHIVKPAEHSLTNHFGNRLSLCGWHYTLISYGQWDLLHPDTQQTIDKDNLVDQLQDILCPSTDSINDDTLTRVAIRFSNLYLNWEPKPEQIIETILFSRPHREYLCRLLKTEKLLND